MSTSSNNNVSIPSWVNIVIYLTLLLLLWVCGDLLTFILGFIGVTAMYVGYFNHYGDKSENTQHH